MGENAYFTSMDNLTTSGGRDLDLSDSVQVRLLRLVGKPVHHKCQGFCKILYNYQWDYPGYVNLCESV